MSEYIAKMWAKNNPTDPPVTQVRLSLANHPTGKKHCMAREKWSRPPIEEIPKKYLREVGVFPISSDTKKTTPSKKSNALQKVPSKVQKKPLKVPIMKKTMESKVDDSVSEPKQKEE